MVILEKNAKKCFQKFDFWKFQEVRKKEYILSIEEELYRVFQDPNQALSPGFPRYDSPSKTRSTIQQSNLTLNIQKIVENIHGAKNQWQ